MPVYSDSFAPFPAVRDDFSPFYLARRKIFLIPPSEI